MRNFRHFEGLIARKIAACRKAIDRGRLDRRAGGHEKAFRYDPPSVNVEFPFADEHRRAPIERERTDPFKPVGFELIDEMVRPRDDRLRIDANALGLDA